MDSLPGKRLIIFGCGYVGSALARAALAGGARVEALTRNPEKAGVLRAAVRIEVVGEAGAVDIPLPGGEEAARPFQRSHCCHRFLQ